MPSSYVLSLAYILKLTLDKKGTRKSYKTPISKTQANCALDIFAQTYQRWSNLWVLDRFSYPKSTLYTVHTVHSCRMYWFNIVESL